MQYDIRLLNLLKTLLIERALTVSVAESSSGGLLTGHLTHLPGSSIYFKGGIIAYANDAKKKILLINETSLRTHGAVSSEVALAMAQEVKRIFNTDIGVAVSGITGPSGGSEEKPVGLTYVSISASGFERTERYLLEGDREKIRQKSVNKALALIHEYLHQE